MNITTTIGMTCAKLTLPLTILVCLIFVLRMIGKNRDKQSWIHTLQGFKNFITIVYILLNSFTRFFKSRKIYCKADSNYMKQPKK